MWRALAVMVLAAALGLFAYFTLVVPTDPHIKIKCVEREVVPVQQKTVRRGVVSYETVLRNRCVKTKRICVVPHKATAPDCRGLT